MKAHDRVIAILAVLVFTLLALPYQFESSYWAESPILWGVYIVIGVVVSAYAFYVFLRGWRRIVADKEDSHDGLK